MFTNILHVFGNCSPSQSFSTLFVGFSPFFLTFSHHMHSLALRQQMLIHVFNTINNGNFRHLKMLKGLNNAFLPGFSGGRVGGGQGRRSCGFTQSTTRRCQTEGPYSISPITVTTTARLTQGKYNLSTDILRELLRVKWFWTNLCF